MGARVVAVDAKRQRATIDRGKSGGVSMGQTGVVYPMRAGDQSDPVVDLTWEVARGKVVRVENDRAIIALDKIVNPITEGALFSYVANAPDELTSSALFRITARGIVLQRSNDAKPFITIEAMLADRSANVRDKALDAMLAEVRAAKPALAKSAKPVVGGPYHGKLVGEVIDRLDRAAVEVMLGWIDSTSDSSDSFLISPHAIDRAFSRWSGHSFTDGTWYRKQQLVKPLVTAARAALARGRLEDARAEWKRMLAAHPDSSQADSALAALDRIKQQQRLVAADPDDAASRYTLMVMLYNLGAYGLALAEYPRLAQMKYKPVDVEGMRGHILKAQEAWTEAAAFYKRFVAEHPFDANAANDAHYTAAKAKLAKDPGDVAGLLELAAYNEDVRGWSEAMSLYRLASGSDRASVKEREHGTNGVARARAGRDLEDIVSWAKGDIVKHDLVAARERVERAVKIGKTVAEPRQLFGFLGALAEEARGVAEDELALELAGRHAELAPDRQGVHLDLGWSLMRAERFDDAEQAAKKALTVKGDSNEFAYAILGLVALARGDMTALEKHARSALKPTLAWGHELLARTEAARGDWQEAVEHARKALEIARVGVLENAIGREKLSRTRAILAATTRGLQAHEALQANGGIARERLRLVRALADLGLTKRASEELVKLPTVDGWRGDAWWAIAVSADAQVAGKVRLDAARNATPTTDDRKLRLAVLELTAQLAISPKDDDKRIALARAHLRDQQWHRAIAVAGPVASTPRGSETIRDARAGIAASEEEEYAWGAPGMDYGGAIDSALAAQKVYDRFGTRGRGSVRVARASALFEQGRYAEAIRVGEEAVAITRATGDAMETFRLELTIARMRASIGTIDAVRTVLDAGLRIAEVSDDEEALVGVSQAAAELAEHDARWADTIDHARRAWTLAERVGRSDLARGARYQLIRGHMGAGRLTEGEQLASSLLRDARGAHDESTEQNVLFSLSSAAMLRGRGTAARARYQEIYEAAVRTGDLFARAEARRLIGAAWRTVERDFKKARSAYEQSLALYRAIDESIRGPGMAATLRGLADVHMRLGNLSAARAAAEEGLLLVQRYQRKNELAWQLDSLARIAISDRKGDEALRHATAMVAITQTTDDDELNAFAYHAVARAQTLLGKDQEALDAYEKYLTHIERAYRVVGTEAEQDTYAKLGNAPEMFKDAVQHLLKLGKSARALEVLEQSRNAQLKQTFDPTKVQTTDAKARAKLETYEQKRARVSGMEKLLAKAKERPATQRDTRQEKVLVEQIAKTREDLNALAIDLRTTHSQLYRALAMKPEHLASRRAELPAGAVVVEYFVADDALYAFMISAALTQPAVVRVKVTSADLTKTVRAFREAVIAENAKTRQRDKVEELGRQLDDWLLEPLRPHLKDATTVVILPFGSLYYLPFDALVVSEPGAPVRYAIEDFRFSIQTGSTLDQLLAPARGKRAGSLLAIANPDGTLPGAQREVARITKSLPDARVLGKKDGTVKTFNTLAGGYRYIHLATHGVLDSDPRKSYLKLADGNLTTRDIARLSGLDQANEMVVLSACETATSAEEDGSEVLVSLATGFAIAGAPALVASLWEVGDDSTAELMATFYRALESSGDRLDALRNAKLNLLRMKQGTKTPYAAPWHWASFQMFGDFRAPQP